MEFNLPLAAELSARGHNVAVAAGDSGIHNFGYPSKEIEMARAIDIPLDVEALARWIQFLRKSRPDILVAGTPKASLLSLVAGRIAGIKKRVYVMHGAVWDQQSKRNHILEAAERAALRSSTDVLAVSGSLADLVVERGLAKNRPIVLGQGSIAGVNTDYFHPNPHAAVTEKPRLLFVGRLSRDKNIDALVEVFDLVKQSHDVELHIVGNLDATAPPGPETISRIEQDPSITWHGFQADVRPFYQSASVLVLPTSREGLPQTVLEAQACGLPVVAWAATGVVDAVSPTNSTQMAPLGERRQLARACDKVLSDKALSNAISKDGREWIQSEFEQYEVVGVVVAYLTKPG